MQAKRIIISGRVQGVCFRATAKEKADFLNICGWIKNKNDGSVEIHAEGEDDAIEQFLHWCKEGPPIATVDYITVEDCIFEDLMMFTVL